MDDVFRMISFVSKDLRLILMGFCPLLNGKWGSGYARRPSSWTMSWKPRWLRISRTFWSTAACGATLWGHFHRTLKLFEAVFGGQGLIFGLEVDSETSVVAWTALFRRLTLKKTADGLRSQKLKEEGTHVVSLVCT